jgi:hypothetical protein
MRCISLVLILFVLCSFARQIIVQPVQLYSLLNTVQRGTLHSFLLDYTCLTSSGTLEISINQPNFQNKFGGVFAYISSSPSSGPNAPFPDPSNPSTYQYTTFQNTSKPRPGVVIPNAPPKEYYVLIDALSIEGPQYELSSQVTANKIAEPVGLVGPDFEPPIATRRRTITAPIQQDLYFGNKFVINDTVNWNDFVQFALPMCATAFSKIVSPTVCLNSLVVAQGPGFIFYQFFSTDPNPETINFWQTRSVESNTYDDLSGRAELPINQFKSLPTLKKDFPTLLYQTIFGQGGEGVSPPYPNPFSVYYQIVPCDK